MTRINIECLKCGHHGSMSEDELRKFGEKPDAPIAKFVKRLTCSKCKRGSVKAYRYQSRAA